MHCYVPTIFLFSSDFKRDYGAVLFMPRDIMADGFARQCLGNFLCPMENPQGLSVSAGQLPDARGRAPLSRRKGPFLDQCVLGARRRVVEADKRDTAPVTPGAHIDVSFVLNRSSETAESGPDLKEQRPGAVGVPRELAGSGRQPQLAPGLQT